MGDEAEEDEDWGCEEESEGYGKAGAVGVGVGTYDGGYEGCGGGEVSGVYYDELVGGGSRWLKVSEGRGCATVLVKLGIGEVLFGSVRTWED